MILAGDNLSSDNSIPGGSGQWDNTNRLLRSIQGEYQIARRQLEQVDHHLAERQLQISQHLLQAYVSSGKFQPLCLMEYSIINPLNQLGKTILGGSPCPPDWPVPTGLNIRCLGRFEVRSTSGRTTQWHSAKAKSVFQYLLVRPREPTVKDMITEALWPECSPQAAANNLKVAVHQLKSTLSHLGDEMVNLRQVIFLQGSYLINPEINLWIDVEEFEKHWNTGHRLEKEGNLVEAMREFERAEALYRGDYLAEELYEEWTLLRREALKDIYLIILSKLADRNISLNDYESGINYCQKMLSQDNCREAAYRWLMYCYTKLGQRNRALRWYEICCRIIRNELDTVPEKTTTDLYLRIVNGEEI